MAEAVYTKDDFKNYDVLKWHGAERRDYPIAGALTDTVTKGELLTKVNGELDWATATSVVVLPLFNPIINSLAAGFDSKASGTATVVEGRHQALFLIGELIDSAVVADQELAVGTVNGKNGLVPAALGNRVVARSVVKNGNAWVVDVLEQSGVKA